MRKDTEATLQIIEDIISEDRPGNSSQTTETKEPQSGLNTPILEDINLEEMELETINTDDMVDLFQKEDCWLLIDVTGKTDEVELDRDIAAKPPAISWTIFLMTNACNKTS